MVVCTVVFFSSCSKNELPNLSSEEPTLEEIHRNGAMTLNEALIDVSGPNVWTQMNEIMSIPPIPPIAAIHIFEITGYTKDYLIKKNAKVYLKLPNVVFPPGYYFVDIHRVKLEVPYEPFTLYDMASSPKCGYIPTAYSDQAGGIPISFSMPKRGGFYDGNNSATANFHTFYVHVKSTSGGIQMNNILPEKPENFIWRIAKKSL